MVPFDPAYQAEAIKRPGHRQLAHCHEMTKTVLSILGQATETTTTWDERAQQTAFSRYNPSVTRRASPLAPVAFVEIPVPQQEAAEALLVKIAESSLRQGGPARRRKAKLSVQLSELRDRAMEFGWKVSCVRQVQQYGHGD